MKILILAIFGLFPLTMPAQLELEHSDSKDMKGKVAFLPKEQDVERWTWKRNGVVILSRVITTHSGPPRYIHIEQIIYRGDSKIFYATEADGKRSELYYPDATMRLTRSDIDADGRFDSISLLDSGDMLFELYFINADGLITPESDQRLAERRDFLKSISEKMTGF